MILSWHQQIELLLSPIIRHEIIAIIAKQSVHYSHYLPIISLLSSYYLTIISLLFDLLSLPIIRYYLFQYYYPLLSYLLYAIISNTIYYTHYLRSCAPSLLVHSRTNPGYVQGSLTAHCAAQTCVLPGHASSGSLAPRYRSFRLRYRRFLDIVVLRYRS